MLCQLHEKVPGSSQNLRWWQLLSEPDPGWRSWKLILLSPLLLPRCLQILRLPFSSDNRSWCLKEAPVSHSSRSPRSEPVCGEGHFLVLQSDLPYVLPGYFLIRTLMPSWNPIPMTHSHPCLLPQTFGFSTKSLVLTLAAHTLKLEQYKAWQ